MFSLECAAAPRRATMAQPDAWKSDILVSALLVPLAAYLEFQPPFERHLVPETLPRVSYLPRSRAESKRAIVGLQLAVTLGFAVTNALKNSVGAFRPDFRAYCWPKGAKTAWEAPGIPKWASNHDTRLVKTGNILQHNGF